MSTPLRYLSIDSATASPSPMASTMNPTLLTSPPTNTQGLLLLCNVRWSTSSLVCPSRSPSFKSMYLSGAWPTVIMSTSPSKSMQSPQSNLGLNPSVSNTLTHVGQLIPLNL